MKKTSLLYIAALICLCSCENKTKKGLANRLKGFEKFVKEEEIKTALVKKGPLTEIKVPRQMSDSVLPLGKMITTVEYVPLETNDRCLIGKIDQLFFVKDKIIVVDKTRAEGIYIFNRSGKFINAITSKGKGPGEFNTIRDVTVNANSGNILLLDDYTDKVNIYSPEGKFLNYKKITYYFREFNLLKDSLFVSYCKQEINQHIPSIAGYTLITSESGQGIVSRGLPFKEKFIRNQIENADFLTRVYDGVLYSPTFSDTIYKISDSKEIYASYYLNMGDDNVLQHITDATSSKDFINLLNTNKYVYYNGKILETPSYVYVELSHGGRNALFFSKKDQHIRVGVTCDMSGLSNVRFFNNPIAAVGDTFVSVLNPVQIAASQKILQSLANPRLRNSYDPAFLARMDKITENDNPVLMLYGIKL